MVQGTMNGITSGVDGSFALNVNKADTLVVSFLGYKTQYLTPESTMAIKLASDAQELDEVVVIGYGVVRKKEVTGAVSQVKSADLQKQLNTDLGNSLQGMVAGVSVASESGAPGAGATILIRGITSIDGGNTPLYVVDGVPYEGDPGINPNEIESMDILKDAASCAIYGTRGAAGVILITTKTGTVGKPKVTFDAFYGVKMITSQDYLMDAVEQTYFNMVTKRLAQAAGKTDDDMVLDLSKQPTYFHNNTNLMDEVFVDNARTQNYSLTFSGGVKGITYSLVAGYTDELGSIINSGYDRFNTRGNFGFTSPNKKLKINANFNLTQENKESAVSSILLQSIKYYPTQPSMSTANDAFESGSGESDNRIKGIMDSYFTEDYQKTNNSTANLSLNYTIIDGLKLSSKVAFNRANGVRSIFRPYNKIISSTGDLLSKPSDSFVSEESINRQSLIWDFGGQYQKQFNKHKITALAMITGEEYRFEGFVAKQEGVLNNDITVLGGTSINPSAISRTNYTNRLIGTLARLQYDWNSRYLLSVSVRYDGSSKFAPGNQWGLFPSASAAWNMSDENFFKSLKKVVNNLKIRASYGTTGNQNFGAYGYIPVVTSGLDMATGESESLGVGVAQSGYANPEVKWETSKQVNLGVDFGLWQNKFTLTAELYKTNKSDMLFPIVLASSNGTTTPVTLNVGDMTNQGFELATSYRSSIGKNLKYTLSATFSTNRNEITKISGDGNRISASTTGLVQGAPDQSYVTYMAEGYPAGAFFLYKTNGIVNSDEKLAEYRKIKPSASYGDLIYEDFNGDGQINDSDLQYCGSGLPDYEIGFNISMEYKGFDLYANFYSALGHEIMNGSRATAFAYGRHKDLLGQYSATNINSPVPTYYGDIKSHMNYQGNTDMWLEDGSYLRLKNVTLGYTLPERLSTKLKMKKCRVYVAGQNLFTITGYSGYDPGIGGGIATRGMDIGNYPVSTTVMGGVNLIF